MRKEFWAGYILVALFVILSLLRQNYEFVGYALFIVPFLILLHYTDRWFSYSPLALWGFVAWMLLHLCGGLVMIGDTRLYDLILIPLIGDPYFVLKYDQFLHFYCYVVMALLLGSVVLFAAKKETSPWLLGTLIALAAAGIGSINEIIEFGMVIFLNNQGVGGYTNTAIDIVANFIGAVAGAILFLKR